MLDSLRSLLQEQIRSLHSAETQLARALPRLARRASSESLRAALWAHLEETRGHIDRLADAAQMLEIEPGGKCCRAMQGLIDECREALDEEGQDAVVDAAIIAAAQRVEHYEIACYGSALALAELLKESMIVGLLQETLDEEQDANEVLADICHDEVYPAYAMLQRTAASRPPPGLGVWRSALKAEARGSAIATTTGTP